MARKTGFLANLKNVPPLVFRFQFNPELMSDKKSYTYKPVDLSRKWDFSEARKARGLATLVGFYKDLEGVGPTISNTRSLNPCEGDQRTIAIDFHLNASPDLPVESRSRVPGTIEPDIAVLRSFMYPAYKVTELPDVLTATEIKPPNNPPECNLVYGGLRLTCVMTDLNIKITAFQDDGSPLQADVSLTLKEQTFSISPLSEYFDRLKGSAVAVAGLSIEEVAVASPIGFLFD